MLVGLPMVSANETVDFLLMDGDLGRAIFYLGVLFCF